MSAVFWGVIGAVLAVSLTSAAGAQSLPVVGAEVASEESRRGLSWSEGRASASADIFAELGAVEAGVRIAALRGAERHGDSDVVADLNLGTRWDVADLTVRLRATGHLFGGGRGKRDYGEVTGSLGYTYGPVQLTAGATYAPHQDAIGGSNLYLFADASAGIPTTPFTLIAGVGRSSGDSDGDPRARRLRPDGRYLDWRVGVEHVRGPLVLGLDYVGTNIDENRLGLTGRRLRDDGDRLIARVRVSF